MLAKLRTSFGSLSGNNTSKGYHGGEQPRLATYLVPGTAAVQVSGAPMAKPIASLEPGEKILCVDLAAGSSYIWSNVQDLEVVPDTSQLQNTIVVGLGGHDTAPLKADQAVLAINRKKKPVMQPIRRLEIGVDTVVLVNADGLRSRHKKVQEFKKISSRRLLREKDSTESLYKLTVGSTNHSLLMAGAQDSSYFFMVDSLNSTVDLNAVTEWKTADAEKIEGPKVEFKNTFVTVKICPEESSKEGSNDLRGGMVRSYSDTDIQKLVVELDMAEEKTNQTSIFATDDMISSGQSGTSYSNSLQSEVSSLSGGSVSQVRIGTQTVSTEDGRPMPSPTNQVHFSEYMKLPVNEIGDRLPAASVSHQNGRRTQCRKCAFYNTFSHTRGKSCKNGALCDFCHESHYRFIHRRKPD